MTSLITEPELITAPPPSEEASGAGGGAGREGRCEGRAAERESRLLRFMIWLPSRMVSPRLVLVGAGDKVISDERFVRSLGEEGVAKLSKESWLR